MVLSNLVLILGGTRSGKSYFAEKLANHLGKKIGYIATAEAGDEEMAQRIKQHRLRRPESWLTREETHELLEAIRDLEQHCDVIIVECLSLWISNLMERFALNNTDDIDKDRIIEEILRVMNYCVSSQTLIIVVGSEVSLGIVPENKLTRDFRDINGTANQEIARRAREVYFVTAGIAMEIKSKAYKL